MQLLFRLPFLLLEALLRRGLEGVAALRQLVRGDRDDGFVSTTVPPSPAPQYAGTRGASPQAAAAPVPPARSAPAAPPPPTAEEAIARSRAREAAAPAPSTDRSFADGADPSALRAVADLEHVDREAEVVESFGPADDVGGMITVDEPWDGYDGMPAAAIVRRVRGADPATKGVVRLYERQHKGRATVLRATG